MPCSRIKVQARGKLWRYGFMLIMTHNFRFIQVRSLGCIFACTTARKPSLYAGYSSPVTFGIPSRSLAFGESRPGRFKGVRIDVRVQQRVCGRLHSIRTRDSVTMGLGLEDYSAGRCSKSRRNFREVCNIMIWM